MSKMTNLSTDDTWKIKIYDALCRKRTIKMARVAQQARRASLQAMTALFGLFMSLCVDAFGRGHREKWPWAHRRLPPASSNPAGFSLEL